MSGHFDCEAYGPEIAHVGAVCFISGELGKRVCASPDACHESMTAQRQRVYSRISELAAQGNPDFEYLADAFGSPDQILGGRDGAEDEKP